MSEPLPEKMSDREWLNRLRILRAELKAAQSKVYYGQPVWDAEETYVRLNKAQDELQFHLDNKDWLTS